MAFPNSIFPSETTELDKEDILRFTAVEPLPWDTQMFQVDDGTIFYLYSNQRLYVKWEGREISIDLPERIYPVAIGNAVHFKFREKIHKAVFEPPDSITTSFVRDRVEETWSPECFEMQRIVKGKNLWTRLVDGQMSAYRTWGDPNHAVSVDCSDEELKDAYLLAVLKDQVIFERKNHDIEDPEIRKLSDNVLFLEMPMHKQVHYSFYRPTSRYFYFISERSLTYDLINGITNKYDMLFIIDLKDLRNLRSLGIEKRARSADSFQSILDEVLVTTEYDDNNEFSIMATLLPVGYYEQTTPVSEEWRKTCDKIKEMQEQLPDPDGYISEFHEKFKPINILGSGGYGCVFEAEFKLLKRRYAVKRIPIKSGNSVDAALTEVLALDSLNHPGIVKYNHSWVETPPGRFQARSDACLLKEIRSNEYFTYDKGCSEGYSFLYITMELCKSTLSTWLSDRANMNRDFENMKSWFKQLFSAVAYIHNQGLIHRDLKPSNILFGPEKQLKICDLGISTSRKIIDDQEVSMSRTFDRGTVKYMAPEQNGWAYTAKVDIFSLGLILAELWVPMSDDLAATVFDNYRSGRPNTVLSQYPEAERLVNWMTSVNDFDRPDCEEIAKHKFLSGLN